MCDRGGRERFQYSVVFAVSAGEWESAGKEFIRQDGKRVLVRGRVLLFGHMLFRSHVRRRSGVGAASAGRRVRLLSVNARGDAEIQKPRVVKLSRFAENDVFRFHVPVKNAFSVDRVQRVGDRIQDRKDRRHWEAVFVTRLGLKPLAERLAFCVRHHEKRSENRVHIDPQKRADVRMVERLRQVKNALDLLHCVGIVAEFLHKKLADDFLKIASSHDLHRQPRLPHSALAELLLETVVLVFTQKITGREVLKLCGIRLKIAVESGA